MCELWKFQHRTRCEIPELNGPRPLPSEFMSTLDDFLGFLKPVFQRHAWEYSNTDPIGTRTCSVCGERHDIEHDAWGARYAPVRDGDPAKHASRWNPRKKNGASSAAIETVTAEPPVEPVKND